MSQTHQTQTRANRSPAPACPPAPPPEAALLAKIATRTGSKHVTAAAADLEADRCAPLGIELVVCDPMSAEANLETACGVMVQAPDTYGSVTDWTELAKTAKAAGAIAVMAADLLSLPLLTPAGECGFYVAICITSRLGAPLGI